MNNLNRSLYSVPQSMTPTDDPKEQATHAASPNDFNFTMDAKTVVFALLGFYVVIYGVHVAERVVRR